MANVVVVSPCKYAISEYELQDCLYFFSSDQIELDVETGVNGRNGFVHNESIFEEVEENRNPDPTIAEPEM